MWKKVWAIYGHGHVYKGGNSMTVFTKNTNFWAPWNFWKSKLWYVCAGAQGRAGPARRNFGIGLLKSYLTFGYLTCSVQTKKKFHTPPYWSFCPRSEYSLSESEYVWIFVRICTVKQFCKSIKNFVENSLSWSVFSPMSALFYLASFI